MVRDCRRSARTCCPVPALPPFARRCRWALLLVVLPAAVAMGQVPAPPPVTAPPSTALASPIPLATAPGAVVPGDSGPPVGPLYTSPPAAAPNRRYHYFQRADMPPGSIGNAQLMRGGPLPGHFQAVEVSGPEGCHLALAVDGFFEPPQPAPLRAGLLVGNVYRLRVTNIPFREGQEVFPSVEIINRLYPPAGSETRFPIPIQLTREELDLSLGGQFVIRVIYLENPRTALPRREDPAQQRYFEVGPGQDPLEVADSLGRPMAILRIGSRVPDMDQATGRFLFHCPPWTRFSEVVTDEPSEATNPPSWHSLDPAAALPGRTRLFPSTAQRPLSNVGVNQ